MNPGRPAAVDVLYELHAEDLGLSASREMVHVPRLVSVPAWVGAGWTGLRPATVHEPLYAATLAAFAGGDR